MSQLDSIHGRPGTSSDELPNKKQKLANSGSQSGGEMEHDDVNDKPAKVPGQRRTYPEPSFDVERAVGAKGRASYTVATKLNVIDYTRLKCSDGGAVGNRGAANRLNLDPKRVREWVQNEGELRAAKDHKGKASARSLNKGTTPSPQAIEDPTAAGGDSLPERATATAAASPTRTTPKKTPRKRPSPASLLLPSLAEEELEDITMKFGGGANSVRKPALPTKALSFFSKDAPEGQRPLHYAVDAEMVTVVGPGEIPERRAMVSVGVVNERLETLLYGRVAVPRGSRVTNGAFARAEGGLWAGWDEGMPARCVSEFLARHASSGGVIVGWEVHGDLEVTGFEKAAKLVKKGEREDLPLERVSEAPRSCFSTPIAAVAPASPPGQRPQHESLSTPSTPQRRWRKSGASEEGSEKNGSEGLARTKASVGRARGAGASNGGGDDSAVAMTEGGGGVADDVPGREEGVLEAEGTGGEMRVVEVTDLFRTMKGLKCSLNEAYTCCFDRTETGVHNAAVDARMTMELYNLWRRAGEPDHPLGLPFSFFVLNFHSFKPSRSRDATLWSILRPEGDGRGIALEKDSGNNTYKLLFRSERDRQAHLARVEARMAKAGLTWGEDREFVPGKKSGKDGYQLCCGSFKMHVLEIER